MREYEILQLILFLVALFVLTKPMGLYLHRVLDVKGKTFMDFCVQPLERLIYRMLGIDPRQEQDWKQYSVSLIFLSLIGTLATYIALRSQHILPLNPEKFGPVAEHLSFNTAVSFATNTNWQSYSGESCLSYFSQMVGLTFHNFISAAVGISVAAALVRGIARRQAKTVGNFWVDLIRVNLYLLIPLSFLIALFMVSQGMIQNFNSYVVAQTVDQQSRGLNQVKSGAGLEPSGQIEIPAPGNEIKTQTIAQGPMASQVAIKLLGTNGGGFMNANASHPYENPTPLSNFIQMLIIFLIPSGLTYYLGGMVKNQWHGWSIWSAMLILFLVGVFFCVWAESAGNPRFCSIGVDPGLGNMEGKEVRFGIFSSAMFAVVTSAASCGAVNSMHDSFMPIGGMIPLLNIQLGEVIFGGVGSGLYGMLVFVVLTVFLAGLMIGRTPEYLGKKIETYDVKMAMLFIMVPIISILGLTAFTIVTGWGVEALTNHGPHGLTEILYAYTSASGNNGSAFAGLNSNSPEYNTLLGIAMLFGRFLMIVPVMALAGNMAKKKLVPVGPGAFPVSGVTFTVLVTATVFIVGVLTFFPSLSLGPILEHFILTSGFDSF
ncbi:MAG: potassium-transporting ATPase subunit KdpA [Desulfomonilaceae bacterium]